MPAGAEFVVIATGNVEGDLEFQFSEDEITVFGWSGSVVRLWQDGHELGAGKFARTIVPPTPPGKKLPPSA
jgi:hypothetical protein